MPNISGVEGVVIALYVFAILGTLRLIALSHKDNKVARAFLLLY